MFSLPPPKTPKSLLCVGIIEAKVSRSLSLDFRNTIELKAWRDKGLSRPLKWAFSLSLYTFFSCDRLDKLAWYFIELLHLPIWTYKLAFVYIQPPPETQTRPFLSSPPPNPHTTLWTRWGPTSWCLFLLQVLLLPHHLSCFFCFPLSTGSWY